MLGLGINQEAKGTRHKGKLRAESCKLKGKAEGIEQRAPASAETSAFVITSARQVGAARRADSRGQLVVSAHKWLCCSCALGLEVAGEIDTS